MHPTRRLLPLLLPLCVLACQQDTLTEPVSRDASVPQSDVDSDTRSTDTSRDILPACAVDPDDDGLNNCTENDLCTDPNDADTDDDGLNDRREVTGDTSPCDADTDDDGLDDDRELDLGLDPTDSDSDDDGTIDGDESFLDRCRTNEPANLRVLRSAYGDWTFALPDHASAHTLTADATAPPFVSSFTLEDSHLAGFLFAHDDLDRIPSPEAYVQNNLRPLLEETGSVTDADWSEAQRDVHGHDDLLTLSGTFSVRTDSAVSPADLRRQLLVEATTNANLNIPKLHNTDAGSATAFDIGFTSIIRPPHENNALVSTSLTVIPTASAQGWRRLRFRGISSHLNMTTHNSVVQQTCELLRSDRNPRPKDLLFVVDGDGSATYRNRVSEVVSSLSRRFHRIDFDLRIGVTNMQPANSAAPVPTHGWFTDPDSVTAALGDAAFDCETTPDWTCGAEPPHGLAVTDARLESTREDGNNQSIDDPANFRLDADPVIVWLTDQTPASVGEGRSLEEYASSFAHAAGTFFHFYSGEMCPSPTNADAYAATMPGTSSDSVDLCSDSLADFYQYAPHVATDPRSPRPIISEPPVPASVKVFIEDNTWVPRSRDNGFYLHTSPNRIHAPYVFLTGDFHPLEWAVSKSPRFTAVSYRHFVRCAELAPSRYGCP